MAPYGPHVRDDQLRFARPDTPDYEAAVASFNLDARLRPAAAKIARTVHDVRRAIGDATRAGLPVLPFSTGHAAAMIAPIADPALVVRVALDSPVGIDPDRGIATIPAGTRWGTVIDAAAEHDFGVAHGGSRTVGAIGYLLGGGMSFYGRAVGVAANSIVSITIVLADGTVTTVDHEHRPDLFWALRGGGGGFGVVVSVEMRLLPMWRVISGRIAWDASDAAAVPHAWRDWSTTAPREITTSMRLLRFPDLPMTPEPFRNREVLMLLGAITVRRKADLDHARQVEAALLNPLRAIARPLLDTWQLGDAAHLPESLNDPHDPIPSRTDHFCAAGVDDRAMEQWFRAVGPGSGSRLMVAELNQLGGAIAVAAPDGGAVSSTNAEFSLLNFGIVTPQTPRGAIDADADRVRRALAAYDTGFTMPTYVENPTRPRRTFTSDVEQRVDAIRARVDPDGLFRLDTRRTFQPKKG